MFKKRKNDINKREIGYYAQLLSSKYREMIARDQDLLRECVRKNVDDRLSEIMIKLGL